MSYKFLIVGSGLFGATCARLLTDAGYKCLVIEKRGHIGGNVYDEVIDGTIVNKYGGHIFHTNADKIWRFVNRFSDWTPYEHRVKVATGGQVYSFPPNLLTMQQLGLTAGRESAETIEAEIMRKFFVGYSVKQWGRKFEDIPQSVIKRIPIRYNYDDRYFSDKYQAMPKDGYTPFMLNLLRGIEFELGVDYLDDDLYWNRTASQVIYTGMIDRFYGYDLGRLEYRSLTHTTRTLDGDALGCATMNYPDIETPYTRVMEWKWFGYQTGGKNVLTWEYPVKYDEYSNEPYYPVPDDTNRDLYRKYRARLDGTKWLHMGGRLGSYQYYNMDQAIAAAMALVEGLRK